MGVMNVIAIVVVALIVLAIVSPDNYEKLKDKAFDTVGWDNDSDQGSDDNDDNNANDNDDDDETNDDDPTDEEDEEDDEVIESSGPSECGGTDSDYPDYLGTEKEGDTCADVPVNPDWECIASPPLSYDGLINHLYKTSDPEIKCCLDDGKCYWS